jgi:hypothetical protein
MRSERKRLSICFTGRNDTYGGKFVDRLALSVNYLSANAKQLGLLNEIEVLVSDWGSDIPLSKVVNLTPEGISICKFINVPKTIAQKYNYRSTQFHTTIPVNVAIRRACGDFIHIGPADILYPEYQLNQLMKLLKGELHPCFDIKSTGMLVGRNFLPFQFHDELAYNNFKVIDKYLLFCDNFAESGSYIPGISTGYGAILLHKAIWFELEGLDEQFRGWGFSDIEIGLKINQSYPFVNLSKFGIKVYDFSTNTKFLHTKLDRLNKFDQFFYKRKVNDNWGLSDHDLQLEYSNYESCTNKLKSEVESVEKTTESLVQSLVSNNTREFLVANFHHNIPIICSSYFPLAWFALNNKCFKYLNFGSDARAPSIISAVNPCAEIFIIPPDSAAKKDAHDVPYILKQASELKQHKGQVRFIPGDVNTSINRLKKSFIGKMYFDLVFIQTDNLTENAMNQIKGVLQYIPEGGGLVITGSNIEFCRNIVEKNVNFCCITSTLYKVCLFLNIELLFETIDQHQLQKELKNVWKPIKRKKISLYLAYLSKLFSRLSNAY